MDQESLERDQKGLKQLKSQAFLSKGRSGGGTPEGRMDLRRIAKRYSDEDKPFILFLSPSTNPLILRESHGGIVLKNAEEV